MGTDEMAGLVGKHITVMFTGFDRNHRPRVTRIFPDATTQTAPVVDGARAMQLQIQQRLVDDRNSATPVYEESRWSPLSDSDAQTCVLSRTEPMLYCSDVLDFGASVDPHQLAQRLANAARGMGALMHQHPKLSKAFRLEIVPTEQEGKWCMQASLHPRYWIRVVLAESSAEERTAVVANARAWIDQIKSGAHIAEAGDEEKSANPELAEIESLPDARRPCKEGGACGSLPRCSYFHSNLTCVRRVQRRDGQQQPCGWTAQDSLVLWQSPAWLLLARVELIRDVLLLPRPPIHASNAEMVLRVDFWLQVISTFRQLHSAVQGASADASLHEHGGAITCIATNFGKWETATSKDDSTALSCHAHTHFLMTPQAVSALSQAHGDSCSFERMAGRMGDPPSYNLENALLLEKELAKCAPSPSSGSDSAGASDHGVAEHA